MKKFYISLVSVLMLAVAVLFIGDAASWWSISARAEGLLGLLAIVPAVLWIFFKGVNIINIGLYLGGIDYILIKKFLSLSQSVALIIIEAVLIIAVLCLVCAKKNKELSEDKGTEEKEKEAIGG